MAKKKKNKKKNEWKGNEDYFVVFCTLINTLCLNWMYNTVIVYSMYIHNTFVSDDKRQQK